MKLVRQGDRWKIAGEAASVLALHMPALWMGPGYHLIPPIVIPHRRMPIPQITVCLRRSP